MTSSNNSEFDLFIRAPKLTVDDLLTLLDFSEFSDAASIISSASPLMLTRTSIPAVSSTAVGSSVQAGMGVETAGVEPSQGASEMAQSTSETVAQEGGGRMKQVHFIDGEIKRAFTVYIEKTLIPDENDAPYSLIEVLNSLIKRLRHEYTRIYDEKGQLKIWISMKNKYRSLTSDEVFPMGITTKPFILYNKDELTDIIKDKMHYILERNDNLVREKSNVTFLSTEEIVIKATKWAPLQGRA